MDKLCRITATPFQGASASFLPRGARPAWSVMGLISAPFPLMGSVSASTMQSLSTEFAAVSPAAFLPKKEVLGKSGASFATHQSSST